MNEHEKQEPQIDQDVIGLLKKIQQQLNFLEIKLDKLMGQSSGRPSFNRDRDRRFGRPFRPSGGGGDFRRERTEHGDKPRDKGFGGERHFDKPFDKNRPPERGRKAFFRNQQQKIKGPKGHFSGR